jgi:large subunit ribosomal protein L9
MEVILVDDVFELGRRGDVVKVADGYGRNYLIPKKLAVQATPGNLIMVEQQRLAMAKKEAKYVEEAELLAQELGQTHVLISRKSGETGVLFGSVTSKDIGDVLEASGINLDRRKILLAHPVKNIGSITIEVRPHRDVSSNLLVSVLPEGEETVARTIKRGEESDQIVRELEEKVAELAGAAETPSDERTPAEA